VATVRTYWDTLGPTRDLIALAMGTDLQTTPPDMRSQSNATLAVVAALVKALVEDGVLTAEQLQTVLDAAQGADGSTWAVEAQTDDVVPLPFIDYFGPEAFDGTNGVAVDESNSDFAWGPVVDPVVTGTVSAVFDTSQKYAGTSSLKTVTNDGAALALRAALFQAVPEFYIRFYFNAAAAPATGNCRIYAAQFEPVDGTTTSAERWSFEVAVDSSGHPVMYDNGTIRAPGSTPPNICDGTWWRVEAKLSYLGACELRLYGGADVATTTITFSWTGTYAGGLIDTFLIGQPRSALTSGQSWTTWHDNVDVWTKGWLGP
jgi:hypothetical protein